MLPNELPQHGKKQIFESVNDVLESNVEASFFLSSGYLRTLERHATRQESKGYGFGYNIVNRDGIKRPIATTLLATGGSGKERNLVIDKINGVRWSGAEVRYKKTPINSKNVRMMTPVEWGRLQGFIGYAFVDEYGVDQFRFPEGMKSAAMFKQLGNSVSIPVIEEMADFVVQCMEKMIGSMGALEKMLLELSPDEVRVYRGIVDRTKSYLNKPSWVHCAELLHSFGCHNEFSVTEAAAVTKITTTGISYLLKYLCDAGCLKKVCRGKYSLSPLKDGSSKVVFGPKFGEVSKEVSVL
jgi:DNA (cytosine-5)-methyltransferase 1